jgi:dTDP-4-dehydrorhamnose reductase
MALSQSRETCKLVSMNILVTGATGQLGREITNQFEAAGHAVVGMGSKELNVASREQVVSIISQSSSDWVIHAAAWTNVDEAAKNPEGAMEVNGKGSRHVAEACAAIGAKMVYISSNEVFAGETGKMYAEAEAPNPINAYGESKLAGEQAVREALPDGQWVIARVSWLYGPTSERNFPNKIIQAADKLGALKVVDDEISTPTYVPDLAAVLRQVVENDISGILHLVNEGYCSRYDWAVLTLRESGRGEVPVERIKLADFERASTPPAHAVLINYVAKSKGLALPEWKESASLYARALGKR